VQQLEVGYGRIERGDHKVPNAQETEAGDGSRRIVGAEREEEDLDNVVVALEVAQGGVSPENSENDVGQFLFPPVELGVGFYTGSVCSM
jgi:hypothetical protein